MIALVYEWMKMKYVWINEADFVFAKEDSLVEVPYVEPSFWEVLMSSPWFQGLMAYGRIIWNMLCANKQYVMCCVQYVMYDDACYSHSMNLLIRFYQVHYVDFP